MIRKELEIRHDLLDRLPPGTKLNVEPDGLGHRVSVGVRFPRGTPAKAMLPLVKELLKKAAQLQRQIDKEAAEIETATPNG